jgi:hypothetical protein
MEYIALILFTMKTMEGPGYIFMAYDPFRDLLFNQQVETDDSPQSVLKFVYLLAEDPLFDNNSPEGFTLLLDKHEELAGSMQQILGPLNGKLLFDPAFHHHLTKPVLKRLRQIMENQAD